jgi:hypothetical protein
MSQTERAHKKKQESLPGAAIFTQLEATFEKARLVRVTQSNETTDFLNCFPLGFKAHLGSSFCL